MSIQVKTGVTRGSGLYLDCSVWLDGPSAELDSVEFVKYRLDPTLPTPIRDVRDRNSAFRTSIRALVGFPFTAELHLRDGSIRRVGAAISSPHRQPTADVVSRKRVFVSHSASDTNTARQIADEIQQEGFEVRTSSEMATLVGWTVALHRYLRGRGAVIVLITNVPTPNMWQEIQVADDLHAPTAVLVSSAVQELGQLKTRFTVPFQSANPEERREAISTIAKHFTTLLPYREGSSF